MNKQKHLCPDCHMPWVKHTIKVFQGALEWLCPTK